MTGPAKAASPVYCVDAGHWTGYECPPDCPGVWPFGAYDTSTPDNTDSPVSP